MAELGIRMAHPGDVEVIARIYNHYVLHSTLTFDTEPKSPADRLHWLLERDERHPVLVGEVEDEVVAWGSLNKWGTRPAYKHTVEMSVYVDMDSRRRGIGRAMTEALVSEGERLGHHVLIGQIVSENEASLRLAESMGFEKVGVLKQVGRKFDRWLDVVLMERMLVGPYDLSH